jgi:hypothetical protein
MQNKQWKHRNFVNLEVFGSLKHRKKIGNINTVNSLVNHTIFFCFRKGDKISASALNDAYLRIALLLNQVGFETGSK